VCHRKLTTSSNTFVVQYVALFPYEACRNIADACAIEWAVLRDFLALAHRVASTDFRAGAALFGASCVADLEFDRSAPTTGATTKAWSRA
jgi:hypothetical protein